MSADEPRDVLAKRIGTWKDDDDYWKLHAAADLLIADLFTDGFLITKQEPVDDVVTALIQENQRLRGVLTILEARCDLADALKLTAIGVLGIRDVLRAADLPEGTET